MKCLLAAILFSISSHRAIAGDVATVEGSKKTVSYISKNSSKFFSASQAASAFDWELKIVQKGTLLAFCRSGAEELCIPVQLSVTNHFLRDGIYYLNSSVLGKALSFVLVEKAGKLILKQGLSNESGEEDLPAYNAKWGEGRGFRTGQTLPDIPLFDLEGKEVRFSKYLGKQCIIYCWASW